MKYYILFLNKLSMIDVLYSLVDVNKRLNRLVFDTLYIRNLDLTLKPSPNNISSTNDKMLDQICQKVLCRIHHQINKLTCEPHSIERVFLTNDYPQLYSLSLINFQQETFSQQITGNQNLHYLLNDRITHLVVDITDEKTNTLSNVNKSNSFSLILSVSKRLTDLTYYQRSSDGSSTITLFNLPSTSCISSTLIKLKITVNTFDDCLYLLDGRFECLSTLIINIVKISISVSKIDNNRILDKLKHFELNSTNCTIMYDKQIVPLLRRMINIEELTLFLSVLRIDVSYIDGNQLFNEILVHMPRLNKFVFNIFSRIAIKNMKIDFPSNDDVQSSFFKKGYNQVGSYAGFNPTGDDAKCHVYSLPYQFKMFIHLNNFFQGGLFNKVRYLVMIDTSPFEHQLFKLVSESFPYLKHLYLGNSYPQKIKQHSSTPVVFRHLVLLDLGISHADYAEQLLFENNTRLPELLELSVEYEILETITNNFTNGAARLNCANVKKINTSKVFVPGQNFHQYFPSL